MRLSDVMIRNSKPNRGGKDTKLTDGRGLYLLVRRTGGKLWRMDYRFSGKRKTLAFGAYPDVSLREARERCEDVHKRLSQGIDPGSERKAQKAAADERAANSFEVIAREWFEVWKVGKADGQPGKVWARLESHVFPFLGADPVAEITAPLVLSVLRRMEEKNVTDALRKAKTSISQIMRYAIQTGRAAHDPCPDLKGAFKAAEVKHFASITSPREVGALLRVIGTFKGTSVVRSALLLAPLLFVRPGELRAAKWAEIDLDKAEWRYSVTKTKTEHLVPLARQAVAILRDLQPLTGRGVFVFPGVRKHDIPISNVTINAALKRLGYDTQEEITAHGFRAMARTLLAEELHQRPEVIEHQLAHRVPDALGTAYNRTKFLPERRIMMQLWADYLDKLKAGADVIPLHGGHAA
jgi:integrase